MNGALPERTESRHAWMISVLFWLSLFAAALLYASVALAPRLLNYLRLKAEFHANQVRLVALEKQVGYLDKVAHAMEHEPEFREELARVDFGAARPGDERIAVDPLLTLDARVETSSGKTASTSSPWYGPLLQHLADNDQLRSILLGGSALTVIIAFTFLQDAPLDQPKSEGKRGRNLFAALAHRYRKQA